MVKRKPNHVYIIFPMIREPTPPGYVRVQTYGWNENQTDLVLIKDEIELADKSGLAMSTEVWGGMQGESAKDYNETWNLDANGDVMETDWMDGAG